MGISEAMARRKRTSCREVNGILLLDKPGGMTSNAALQQVKRLYRACKAGHTGSLDPLATGLLPICMGEATKMSAFLLEADKRYHATLELGVRTVTGDSQGEVIARRPVPRLDEGALESALETLRGRIEQTPPMHSAVKRNGVPLYKLAHQGIEVERTPREVTVYDLEIIARTEDRLELAIHCSKGTYVRTLADDLGERLGCGAHVVALRRLGVGGFDGRGMSTIEELSALAEEGPAALDGQLLAMETGVEQWPDVRLNADAAYFLRQGQAVFVPHAPTCGLVRIYAGEGRFLGVGHILDDGRVAPKRLVSC